MKRQTNQPDLLAGRTLTNYTAGLGRLYAALSDHTAYPIPSDPIDAALRAEAEAEADERLWDMVAVVAGVLALVAGAAVGFWLMGGLRR